MAIEKIGELQLDELIATGKTELHTRVIELEAGSGVLKRGQLIGSKTSTSGDVTTTTYAAIATGYEPYAILCDEVTLGGSKVKAMVYVSGHFNGNKVIGYDAKHYDTLRNKSIYVDEAIAY